MAKTFEEWWKLERVDKWLVDVAPQGNARAAWHARDAEVAELLKADEQRARDISRLTMERDAAREENRNWIERCRRFRAMDAEAATEKSDCGHPKMFWFEPDKIQLTNIIEPHCTLCAEVQAAYERGLNDAFDSIKHAFSENARPVILKVILALKDRGAKGGRG
jgi:hypothetical protein